MKIQIPKKILFNTFNCTEQELKTAMLNLGIEFKFVFMKELESIEWNTKLHCYTFSNTVLSLECISYVKLFFKFENNCLIPKNTYVKNIVEKFGSTNIYNDILDDICELELTPNIYSYQNFEYLVADLYNLCSLPIRVYRGEKSNALELPIFNIAVSEMKYFNSENECNTYFHTMLKRFSPVFQFSYIGMLNSNCFDVVQHNENWFNFLEKKVVDIKCSELKLIGLPISTIFTTLMKKNVNCQLIEVMEPQNIKHLLIKNKMYFEHDELRLCVERLISKSHVLRVYFNTFHMTDGKMYIQELYRICFSTIVNKVTKKHYVVYENEFSFPSFFEVKHTMLDSEGDIKIQNPLNRFKYIRNTLLNKFLNFILQHKTRITHKRVFESGKIICDSNDNVFTSVVFMEKSDQKTIILNIFICLYLKLRSNVHIKKHTSDENIVFKNKSFRIKSIAFFLNEIEVCSIKYIDEYTVLLLNASILNEHAIFVHDLFVKVHDSFDYKTVDENVFADSIEQLIETVALYDKKHNLIVKDVIFLPEQKKFKYTISRIY